jgi:hypothetical protein
VLRAGAADVIAFAFYQVGYRPRESLVLVGMRGPRCRLGLVVRVDLPPRRRLRAVVGRQLDVLDRFGDDALMILVISDTVVPPAADGTALPHRPLVRDLQRLARGQGWSVHDVIGIGAKSWRSYTCSDPGCCPTGGRPLQDVLASRVAAFRIADGRVLATEEAALIADVAPHPQADSDPSGDTREPEPTGGLDAAEALRRWRTLIETAGPAGTPSAPAPTQLTWLTEALEDRWLRDAILVTLVPGAGTAAEELLAGGDDGVLDGLLDRAPDQELLERGRILLSAVARTAPSGARVEALALLAWMSWWAGDGARARLLTERALIDRPGHRLAGLVDSLLRVGVAPAWVHASPSVTVRRPG